MHEECKKVCTIQQQLHMSKNSYDLLMMSWHCKIKKILRSKIVDLRENLHKMERSHLTVASYWPGQIETISIVGMSLKKLLT